MKKFTITLIFIIVLSGSMVFGQELQQDEDSPEDVAEQTTSEEGYKFPVIAPEISLTGGYRFTHLNGSPRTEEFEYLHDSIILGSEIRLFSFPHRFHLDLDYRNKKDYFGDISYAYEDMVLFRGINRTLFHNLDNIQLFDLDPSTATPGVDVRDGGRDYGARTGMNNAFLRLKTHDFPFHIYLDGSFVQREGTQQQRSLQGSASFNNIVRTTQKRDVDWVTKSIVVGANSHLGPVEADFSHGEKRFDPNGDSALYDYYTAVGDPLGATRIDGVYAHNLVPELKGSSNTLKLHTSYTGGIVAAATLSKIARENTDSDAKADYFIGAGDISWTISPKAALFVKYRHKDTDMDTPANDRIDEVCSPANNITNDYKCTIRPAISSTTDRISGTFRYRPLKGLSLWGNYEFVNIDREDADEWELPDSTSRSTASLSASFQVRRNLNVKARYIHQHIEDPAYNTDPDNSDEGKIWVTWIPFSTLNAMVSYSTARDRRHDLRFVESDGSITLGQDRKQERDMLVGTVTLVATKNVSATASYAYIHHKTQQDIEYHDTQGVPHLDPYVPDKNMSHVYSLNIGYAPAERVALSGGITHTLSSGAFYPSSPDLLEPISVASFSDLKVKETVCMLSGEYRFRGGFSAGVQYRYSNLDDVLDNPNDDIEDGNAHIVLLSLTKEW